MLRQQLPLLRLPHALGRRRQRHRRLRTRARAVFAAGALVAFFGQRLPARDQVVFAVADQI